MRLWLLQPSIHVWLLKKMARPGKLQVLLMASGVLWLGVVGAGLWVLWDFENRPGVAAHPPAQWPYAGHASPSALFLHARQYW